LPVILSIAVSPANFARLIRKSPADPRPDRGEASLLKGRHRKQRSFTAFRMNQVGLYAILCLTLSWSGNGRAEEPDMFAALDSLKARIERFAVEPRANAPKDIPIGELQVLGCKVDTLGADSFRLSVPVLKYGGLPEYDLSFDLVPDDRGYREKWKTEDMPELNLDMVQQLCNWDRAMFRNMAYYRLKFFLTLSLPLMPSEQDRSAALPITLFLHGRSVDSIEVPDGDRLLKRLAAGFLVNAQLVDADADSLGWRLSFYVVMGKTASELNHFLRIEEHVNSDGGYNYVPSPRVVHFYPFIRTDNLKSLYGDNEIQDPQFREPVRLEKP